MLFTEKNVLKNVEIGCSVDTNIYMCTNVSDMTVPLEFFYQVD